MKEDYLWDKTGEDAEIERLENVLSVFRHQGSEAPMPSVAPLPEPKRGWFFPLRFAFAAGFAAVLVTLAAFLIMPNRNAVPVASVEPSGMAEPPVAGQFTNEAPITRTDVPDNSAVAVQRPEAARSVRAEKIVARNESIKAVRRTAKRHPSPALTAEEKHAYQQLMLALSITGSKLKIVKDAVNGTDAASEDLKKSIR